MSLWHFFELVGFTYFYGVRGLFVFRDYMYSETLNLPQTPVHTVFFDTFVIWPKLNTIFHAKIKIEQSFQL